MNTVGQLAQHFGSGQAGIVLTSVEPEECLVELGELSRRSIDNDPHERWELLFWDCVDGLTDAHGSRVSLDDEDDDIDEDIAALGAPSGTGNQKIGLHDSLELLLSVARERQLREEEGNIPESDETLRILCVRNFDRHLYPSGMQAPPDTGLLTFVQKIVLEGQSSRIFLIMQTTPEVELPLELVNHCEFVHHDLPDEEERLAIITDLGMEKDTVSQQVLDASAGLSRAKTSQYAAETIAAYGHLNPISLFQKKATHLSLASKLDVWSPEFLHQVKLWPTPEIEELQEATDVTMTNEETSANNKQLGEDEIRVRVRYLEDGKHVERWLDPMPKDYFEAQYRPERDFYSLQSVVGLSGLKEFLRNGFRPDVPNRARMKHVLMLGVPGTGKSFMMQCCSGEFQTPLSSMQASNLYSKWLGDTDKILSRMLSTVEMIGGILAIDEFQRFLPSSSGGGESSGVESRLLGTLLTWFNNQQSNLVLSAANNISNLPDEITRSGRVDALMFVGFPGKEAKQAAWEMYLHRHELEPQELPADEYWTPADIMSCCRLAELQQVSVRHASRWITPSYVKNKEQMDELMDWAEKSGCISAETGERFVHPRNEKTGQRKKKVTRSTRRVSKRTGDNE